MALTLDHGHLPWPWACDFPMRNLILPWKIVFFPWAISFQMRFLGVYLLFRKPKALFLQSIKQVKRKFI